jgi:hypothetical protein
LIVTRTIEISDSYNLQKKIKELKISIKSKKEAVDNLNKELEEERDLLKWIKKEKLDQEVDEVL